jgi:hypothetical protein
MVANNCRTPGNNGATVLRAMAPLREQTAGALFCLSWPPSLFIHGHPRLKADTRLGFPTLALCPKPLHSHEVARGELWLSNCAYSA